MEHWVLTASLDQQVVEANDTLRACASRHMARPSVASFRSFDRAYREFNERCQTAEEHRNLVRRKMADLETAVTNMRLAMESIQPSTEAAATAEAPYLSAMVEYVAGLAKEAEGEAKFSGLEGTPD